MKDEREREGNRNERGGSFVFRFFALFFLEEDRNNRLLIQFLFFHKLLFQMFFWRRKSRRDREREREGEGAGGGGVERGL